MSDGFRTWEERDAAAQLTRAQAGKTKAEAEIAGHEAESSKAQAATAKLAEQVKQAGYQRKLDGIRREAKDDKEQIEREKREARADDGVGFKRVATVAVALGLAAALPAQIGYFLGLHKAGGPASGLAWPMLPVPFFLELLAWVGVLGTKWAHRKGLPRGPFWALTGTLASFAGYVNATHGTLQFGLIAGLSLAATSILGPAVWEVRQYLETQAAIDPRDRTQRAQDAERERQEKESQEAVRRQETEQDEQRKQFFPMRWEYFERLMAEAAPGTLDRDRAWLEAGWAVSQAEEWKRYRQLLAADPESGRSRDEVWAAAWYSVHRLPLGTTAATLAVEVASDKIVEEVLAEAGRTPERAAVDLLLADLFPAGSEGGENGGLSGGVSDRAPKGGPSGGGNVQLELAPGSARDQAPASGPVRDENAAHLSRQEKRENAREKAAQTPSGGARKDGAEGARNRPPADSATRRRWAGSRPASNGRTRRAPLSDSELDEQVRALNPEQPTLSARFVAQHIGCDQARAKAALQRTNRLA